MFFCLVLFRCCCCFFLNSLVVRDSKVTIICYKNLLVSFVFNESSDILFMKSMPTLLEVCGECMVTHQINMGNIE